MQYLARTQPVTRLKEAVKGRAKEGITDMSWYALVAIDRNEVSGDTSRLPLSPKGCSPATYACSSRSSWGCNECLVHVPVDKGPSPECAQY